MSLIQLQLQSRLEHNTDLLSTVLPLVVFISIQLRQKQKALPWSGQYQKHYEACISYIRRQKTSLISGQHILRVIIHYSSRNTGTTQPERPKIKTKNTINC